MNILYLCDRRACEKCAPECGHTPDIRHAVNFEMQGENMLEREREAVHVPTFIVQGNEPSEHIKAVARAMAEGYRQGLGIQ